MVCWPASQTEKPMNLFWLRTGALLCTNPAIFNYAVACACAACYLACSEQHTINRLTSQQQLQMIRTQPMAVTNLAARMRPGQLPLSNCFRKPTRLRSSVIQLPSGLLQGYAHSSPLLRHLRITVPMLLRDYWCVVASRQCLGSPGVWHLCHLAGDIQQL